MTKPSVNRARRVPTILLAIASIVAAATTAAASSPILPGPEKTALPGHVLPALAHAERLTRGTTQGDDQLSLTVILRRDDQSGFDRYLREVYEPGSPHFHHFLSQTEIAERFGPSASAYQEVLGYLRSGGFEISEQSANRLLITAKGKRSDAERAFGVQINDYRIGQRTFFANDAEPVVPPLMASRIQAIGGLANLAQPRPQIMKAIGDALIAVFSWLKKLAALNPIDQLNNAAAASSSSNANNATKDPPGGWLGNDGTGQTIGILAFDTFEVSDVADYLMLMGMPDSILGKLSQVHVEGGAQPGDSQAEVLLDITSIMMIAPGAEIVVYDGPFTGRDTSFQRLFNRMVEDEVTIISNSWAYCEDQTTAADVESIDTIFQNAAMAGITVLNASGDTGSTCLNGSANTVAVPANSPSATAVGGTTLNTGPMFLYESETWWNGIGDTPPTGQGGFGVSKFFSRPAYQNGFTVSAARSVPDVVINSDPARGVFICQASAGGCPTGQLFGGTSIAAPIWAAFVAILNQAQGSNLGALNPLLYPLADTAGFHDAESMGSDFAHVGLGSPNLNLLHLELMDDAPGLPDAVQSEAAHIFPVPGYVIPPLQYPTMNTEVAADGDTEAFVLVRLRDEGGNTVAGKTVTLVPDSGDSVVEPSSAVTTVANGAVVFRVTDLTPGDVTFTATDTTDGIVLANKPSITFAVPPAASAGIQAFPTTVTANGLAFTTITVTLTDVLGRPTPGKLITLSQGNGHSIIQGPNPSVTDVNGQIQFTATNVVNEVVTYTAVDVTDGDLAVPGNAVVTFNDGTGTACGNNNLPTAADGFALTPFANGFVAGPLSYGNINFGGCPGAGVPAFRDDVAYIPNFQNGDVFKLPAAGGAATNANKIGTVGPTLGSSVIGKDGRLYATRYATTGNFTTGALFELDLETGAVLRQIVSNLLCPGGMAVDPLSGDLFFSGQCFGAGSNDAAIHRVRNPGSDTPTHEIYATMPGSPNGNLSFAPDGTLYVVVNYLNNSATVHSVSGTDVPGPPVITPLTGVTSLYWVNVGEVDENGSATSLITLSPDGADLRITQLGSETPTQTTIAHDIGGGIAGPDGCLYMVATNGTTVYKLTDEGGGCSFAASSAKASLSLTPSAVDPDPAQGSEQTFTATLLGVEAIDDVPIFFEVKGANPQLRLARTGEDGKADLTYTAVNAGDDVIVASTSVDEELLTSEKARVTWVAGKHTTFLSLNLSPRTGVTGEVVTVIASLTDISLEEFAPVAGADIEFALGGAECSGETETDGIASCELTLPGTAGITELTASFAGDSELLPDDDTVDFQIVGEAIVPVGICADTNANGSITATDALFVLRSAVGSSTCDLCVCDANGSGSITATDSLLVLRVAVGLPDLLDCPGCVVP